MVTGRTMTADRPHLWQTASSPLVYVTIGVSLLALYVGQDLLHFKWERLDALQSTNAYNAFSSLLLTIYLVYQWIGAFIRIDEEGGEEKLFHRSHMQLGMMAPGFFYIHSTAIGYGHLFLLSTIFLVHVIVSLTKREFAPADEKDGTTASAASCPYSSGLVTPSTAADTVHRGHRSHQAESEPLVQPSALPQEVAHARRINPAAEPEQPVVEAPLTPEDCLSEAKEYLALYHREKGHARADFGERMAEVEREIAQTGTYWQTEEELVHGAKVAWRNSNRCIGRIYWKTIKVRDMRHLSTAEEIFEALVEHINLATNGGDIRSYMTLFAPAQPGKPGVRIWNPQLIRYAGYQQADSSVIGDPMHVELTQLCKRLGWSGGPGTRFDPLPLVIQLPGEEPKLFELPPEIVLEVPLEHPRYPWFAELGLKWHALPAVSNFRLEIGGISYTAAPFNGWYMGTEIGARNLGDTHRYNMLPVVAEKLGMDTSKPDTLWQDQALIDLNIAVLHSFQKHGAKMIDHHTASDYFMKHLSQEAKSGRITPTKWSWIVPPISGSATPVFHRYYHDVDLKPNFYAQPEAWKEYAATHSSAEPQRALDTVAS